MTRPDRAGAAPPVALRDATVVVALSPPEVVRADLVIADGRVQSLGPAPPGAATRDCSGTLIVPGNVCSHHHLYSALSRGMPYALEPPTDFTEILQRIWWRLDRALDEERAGLSARGGLDALLAGTTTVIDHHASPNFIDGSLDVIAGALAEFGLRRSALLRGHRPRRPGNGRRPASRRTAASCEILAELPPRAWWARMPLSRCPTRRSRAAPRWPRAPGCGVHIHVAEDGVDERDEPAACRPSRGEAARPRGALDEHALLAHCVHLDDDEIAPHRGAGATVARNARSNMNNSCRPLAVQPASGARSRSDRRHRRRHVRRVAGRVLPPREADLATPARLAARPACRRGAPRRACFGEPLLGTLRPGAPADLCVLSLRPADADWCRRTSPGTGSSGWRRDGSATSSSPASSSSRTAGRPVSTRLAIARRRGPRSSGAAWWSRPASTPVTRDDPPVRER